MTTSKALDRLPLEGKRVNYPDSVVDGIKTAIAGLDYAYTLIRPYSELPSPKFPRSKYTPYLVNDPRRAYGHPNSYALPSSNYSNKDPVESSPQNDEWQVKHWRPIHQDMRNFRRWNRSHVVHHEKLREAPNQPAESTCSDGY